jgi:hypothetical protein
MTPDATLDPRRQYDALAAALSSRKSTTHFAHAGVASVVTLILGGTAGRLFYKGDLDDQQLAAAVGAATLIGLFYALVRVLIGMRRLKVELADFARLQALRSELGLDDPARLMP